jgi:DNA end-binding protein Ku
MAARSSWKGYLKLSLVSVPVKAYTATSSTSSIHLNQLHEECHSRIKYQKVCPIHGEVPNDEIVSAYEYAKGQYVVTDTAELDKLRSEGDKSITVDKFVPADELDSLYHSGTTYYLLPDGPIGQKPYALIRDAMMETGLHGIAQVVISNREQLVRLRPIDGVLGMTVLRHAAEIKQPSGFRDELVEIEANAQELKLTRQLMDGLRDDDFDIAEYPDTYTEKMTQLIQAKVEGQELVSPPAEEEPHVINLMEALKASVSQVKPPKKTAAAQSRPPRKKAASKTTRKKAASAKTPASRKRKKSG